MTLAFAGVFYLDLHEFFEHRSLGMSRLIRGRSLVLHEFYRHHYWIKLIRKGINYLYPKQKLCNQSM